MFSDELKNGGGKIPAGDQFTSPPATRQTRIGNNNIPQDPPVFASLKTNHSPMRSVLKQVGKGKVQDGVRSQIQNCPGFLVEKSRKDETTSNIKSDFQNTCLICQSRTKWFSMICRFYFCMSFKETRTRKEEFYSVRETQKDNQSKRLVYGKSCFHKHHAPYHIRNLGYLDNINEDICQEAILLSNNKPKRRRST